MVNVDRKNLADQSYRLGIEIETSSEAVLRFWKLSLKKTSSLVEGEPYKLTLKFSNLTQSNYAGGEILLVIVWASKHKSYWKLQVPSLGQGETRPTSSVRRDTVGSGGLGLIYCHSLTSNDGKPVTLWNKEGSENYSIGKSSDYAILGLQCTTWVDLCTKYGLIVSALGLGVVALDKVVSLLIWIVRYLLPVITPRGP